jgi:DNA repair exonuclease SbcCD ATPase subunit
MVPRPTRLGRAVFGYRRDHVRQFLLERDSLINEAETEIRTLRRREEEARAESAVLRQTLVQKEMELSVQVEASRTTPEMPTPVLSLEYVREEAYRIMEAAEEGTGRIIRHAREMLDQQLEEQCRKEAEIAEKMEGLASLQESAGMLEGLARETRVLIREVPDRLREALGPLDGVVIRLDDQLEELDQVIPVPEVPAMATESPSPNGSVEAEAIVHIPDEGEATLYETSPPMPPAPLDDPPPRVST